MNFNFTFILFLLFFSTPEEIEQDKEAAIYEVLQNTPSDYFSLKKKLRRLSFEELTNFRTQSAIKNYKIGEIYALNSLGIYYRNKLEYYKAIEHHNEALKICKKNNYIDVQLVCLNLIGVSYRRLDDIRNALDYHQSVISVAKRIKRKNLNNKVSISIAENSLGNIYIALKQYKLAAEQFKKAIDIQGKTKNARGLAINYQNIGEAYENLELYDEALESYQKSLNYNEELNSKLGKVICNNSIASIFIKKGKYKEALEILNDIHPIAASLKNKYYVTETLNNLGWVQVKLQDYDIAFKNLNEALKNSEKLNIGKLLQISVLHHLSELFEKKEDIKNAHFYYKKAIEEEKKTIGHRNNIYINNLISKQELQSKISEFNELQNETKIKSLQLTRNKNILIITLVTIALLSVILYSVYRQHLLTNDQKILLLEQQALQTQMNPHFVFNALNSIKLYIINNEQKNAVYYLNKFSKLIRNILEVSKVKDVSLKEELSTMNLYMSIENIRFDNNINYIEKINPNLNTGTIKLPPLVLQPFLENSIWHGLSSKEGKKEIILSAEKINKNLIEINIMDNGIGREAALKIKKNKSLKRNSVGIDLTKKRLTTFCNEYSNEFSLVYHDLKDSKGNAAGTRVCLQIPLN